MSKALSQVKREILDLPPLERAQLLEDIYRSLEDELSKGRTQKWALEAEARIDAFERGKLHARSYEEVRRTLG